jgi:tetratricopeptide (TPR) repeat protein
MSTMPIYSPRPPRSLRRAWAVAVALSLPFTSLSLTLVPRPAHAIGPARPASMEAARAEARKLTEQGQASFDAGDYKAAAASWQRILDVLPEDSLNRAERENALLIALEAYKHEYRQVQALKGTAAAEDVARLRSALTLCREYAAELTRVYGAQGTVDGAVFESRAEIEAMLAEAGTVPEPVVAPVDPGPQLERTVVERGPTGVGLIVAGSITTAAGLGMLPLIIIGARDLKRANAARDAAEDLDPPDPTAVDAADDRRRRANAMLISGSVLGAVFLAGGATMLGIGIKRRVRYMAFSPALGPTYVGVGVRGRF